MAFESFSAFITMDGHGPYVWTCYGVFFALFILLAWLSVAERRRVIRQQRFQQQLQSTRKDDSSAFLASGQAGFQRIQSSQSESVSKS